MTLGGNDRDEASIFQPEYGGSMFLHTISASQSSNIDYWYNDTKNCEEIKNNLA